MKENKKLCKLLNMHSNKNLIMAVSAVSWTNYDCYIQVCVILLSLFYY
jgi:cell shape-determining protein MreC